MLRNNQWTNKLEKCITASVTFRRTAWSQFYLINEDQLLIKLDCMCRMIRPSYLSFTSWSTTNDSFPNRIPTPFPIQISVYTFHRYWILDTSACLGKPLFCAWLTCVIKCINKNKSSATNVFIVFMMTSETCMFLKLDLIFFLDKNIGNFVHIIQIGKKLLPVPSPHATSDKCFLSN